MAPRGLLSLKQSKKPEPSRKLPPINTADEIHTLAASNKPEHAIRPTSTWIAIIFHTIESSQELTKDSFQWFKAHPKITTKTLKFYYWERHPLEFFRLKHAGKPLDDKVSVRELRKLSKYDDDVVVLRIEETDEEGRPLDAHIVREEQYELAQKIREESDNGDSDSDVEYLGENTIQAKTSQENNQEISQNQSRSDEESSANSDASNGDKEVRVTQPKHIDQAKSKQLTKQTRSFDKKSISAQSRTSEVEANSHVKDNRKLSNPSTKASGKYRIHNASQKISLKMRDGKRKLQNEESEEYEETTSEKDESPVPVAKRRIHSQHGATVGSKNNEQTVKSGTASRIMEAPPQKHQKAHNGKKVPRHSNERREPKDVTPKPKSTLPGIAENCKRPDERARTVEKHAHPKPTIKLNANIGKVKAGEIDKRGKTSGQDMVVKTENLARGQSSAIMKKHQNQKQENESQDKMDAGLQDRIEDLPKRARKLMYSTNIHSCGECGKTIHLMPWTVFSDKEEPLCVQHIKAILESAESAGVAEQLSVFDENLKNASLLKHKKLKRGKVQCMDEDFPGDFIPTNQDGDSNLILPELTHPAEHKSPQKTAGPARNTTSMKSKSPSSSRARSPETSPAPNEFVMEQFTPQKSKARHDESAMPSSFMAGDISPIGEGPFQQLTKATDFDMEDAEDNGCASENDSRLVNLSSGDLPMPGWHEQHETDVPEKSLVPASMTDQIDDEDENVSFHDAASHTFSDLTNTPAHYETHETTHDEMELDHDGNSIGSDESRNDTRFDEHEEDVEDPQLDQFEALPDFENEELADEPPHVPEGDYYNSEDSSNDSDEEMQHGVNPEYDDERDEREASIRGGPHRESDSEDEDNRDDKSNSEEPPIGHIPEDDSADGDYTED